MTGITRRDVIKAQAVAAAAAAAGLPVPALAQNLTTDAALTGLRWAKAPCRFCGTGCSVMVATKNGRVVATHGDAEAEVNRGLNCVKGYFLSKIMYGSDRLTTPLLRKRDGEYHKDGDFEPVTWDEAFDLMAVKWKETLAAKGPKAVGMFGSGQWTIWEGYAAAKLMKAGFRSNNLDPNARHCMASRRHRLHAHLRHRRADGLLRRLRGRRRLRALGREHGGDAPDPLDPHHRPPLQLPARQGRGALDLPQPQLRPRRHPDRLHAAVRPLHPQLHRQPHHRVGRRSTRPSSPTSSTSSTATRTSATACAPSIRWSRRRRTPRTPTTPSR